MAIKEAVVQTWVRERLEKEFEGYVYAFKVPQGQYTSRRGIPDLVFSIYGKFVAVEVKTVSGSLTKLQELELKRINEAKGLGYVIYGKDEAMIQLIIKDIRNDL